MKKFSHLHCHSSFSLLDGASSVNKLAATAKAHGQTSLALTDHGNLGGSLGFYRACKNEGVNRGPRPGIPLDGE